MDLQFTKDKRLPPVDPAASDNEKFPWWADMPKAPTTDEFRKELIEVREMVELRDVPLDDVDKKYLLPLIDVDEGPHLSYFLTGEFKAGPYLQAQNIVPITGKYLDTPKKYEDMLSGKTAKIAYGDPKPMVTGRDLGSAVHKDWPAQFYLRAALMLLHSGVPAQYKPKGKASFIEDGAADLLSKLNELHQKSLRVAWYHKWVNRAPRPEELAAEEGVNLPMLFPEGAPVHPSYPAGHATCAGACITMLKCWFEDVEFGSSTVHRELNKLGGNVAHGRSWAGVHYRSDNYEGLLLGEKVALKYIGRMAQKLDDRPYLPLSYYQSA